MTLNTDSMRKLLTIALLLHIPSLMQAGSSNSLLDVSPDGQRLLVANTDTGSVTVVDLKTRKAVGEIPVGDHPEGVAWVGNSSLGLVTVYGDDVVLFVDATQKKVVHTL